MPGPAVQISSQVIRLARELRTTIDQRFAPLDLTSQQAAILIHVFTGRTSPRDLADLLSTDTAGMTRLLDRLERKGLLRRLPDTGDRRAIVLALTDAGHALIPLLPPIFEGVAKQLMKGVPLKDAQRMLARMLDNL